MLVPENPLSTWLVLSLITFPLIWMIGCAALNDWGGENGLSSLKAGRKVLAPAIGLATWLVTLHCCSLICGTIVWGIVAANVILAVWVVLYLYGHRRSLVDLCLSLCDPSDRLPKSFWLAVLVASGLVAPGIFRFHLHDEILPLGHMSIIAQMQNGVYPPRHLQFPADELRYHYGFNLLATWITAVLRVRIDVAIDLVTLFLWAYSAALLWVFGDRLVNRNKWSGWLMVFITLFGGGLPWLWGQCANLSSVLFSLCEHQSGAMNPPLISFFFQHPWSLGIPLGIAVLYLYPLMVSGGLGLKNYFSLIALFFALAISQMVLFLAFISIFIFCCFVPRMCGGGVAEGRARRRTVLILLTVAVVASRLHCMFLAPYDDGSLGIIIRDYSWSFFRGVLWWDICTFGIPLVMAILAVISSNSLFRLPLTLLAFGALFIFNVFEYRFSWDICKFGAAASFGFGLLASIFCIELLGRISRGVLVFAVILAVNAGAGYAVALALRITGSLADTYFFQELPKPRTIDVEVINWLRQNVLASDMVYVPRDLEMVYAIWGGIPTPWLSGMERSVTYSLASIDFRNQLLDTLPANVVPYEQRGFRWFLVQDSDTHLREVIDGWLNNGEASNVKSFENIRIVKLKKGGDA